MPNLLTGRHRSNSVNQSRSIKTKTFDGSPEVGHILLVRQGWCSLISAHTVQLFLDLLHDMRVLQANNPEIVEGG
jgi:hypothetical protein